MTSTSPSLDFPVYNLITTTATSTAQPTTSQSTSAPSQPAPQPANPIEYIDLTSPTSPRSPMSVEEIFPGRQVHEAPPASASNATSSVAAPFAPMSTQPVSHSTTAPIVSHGPLPGAPVAPAPATVCSAPQPVKAPAPTFFPPIEIFRAPMAPVSTAPPASQPVAHPVTVPASVAAPVPVAAPHPVAAHYGAYPLAAQLPVAAPHPVAAPLPVAALVPMVAPHPAAAHYGAYPLAPQLPVAAPFSVAAPLPVADPYPVAAHVPMAAPHPLAAQLPVAAPHPVAAQVPMAAPHPVAARLPVAAQVPIAAQVPMAAPHHVAAPPRINPLATPLALASPLLVAALASASAPAATPAVQPVAPKVAAPPATSPKGEAAATDPPSATGTEASTATTTTSTATTTTSTATTTSSTATATTSTATTTTTTTTASTSKATTETTTATATKSHATTVNELAHFNETMAGCSICKFIVRNLRQKQERAASLFLNYSQKANISSEECDNIYRDFGIIMEDIKKTFEALIRYTQRLPLMMPQLTDLHMLRSVYRHENTMNHANVSNLIDKMIDTSNWKEGNYQVFYYLSQLLHVNPKPYNYRVLGRKPFNPPALTREATTPHLIFEWAFKGMKESILRQSLGIYPRTLHRTATSLVIEIQFGVERTLEGGDKEIAYTMKFLLVERYGIVEFINIFATHEDWDSYNDFGTKRVNPYTLSRFIYFQKLTKHANKNFIDYFAQHGNRWTPGMLLQYVTYISKFRDVTTTRCRSCRKILKDFLPPMRFDIRMPTIAYHETCPK